MADRGFSNDDMRLIELLTQFLALSNDPTVAGRLILLAPDGNIVGDASLSGADIEAATDAIRDLNIRRIDKTDPPAGPLPTDDSLPLVDPEDVAEMISALQDLADGDI